MKILIKSSYFLFIGLIIGACQSQPNQPVLPANPNDSYHINANIDGVLWTAIQPDNGCSETISWDAYEDYPNDILDISYELYLDQSGMVSPITTPLNGVMSVHFNGFTHVYSDYQSNDFIFHNSFISASSVYCVDGTPSQGTAVSYRDSNGDNWSTLYGSQAGSSFVITENIQTSSNTSMLPPSRRLRGTFSCTLHKELDNMQTKQVTNGNFMVRIDGYD